MANIIIGIHGLGNKPPEKLLEKWWKLAMTEGLRNSGHKTAIANFRLAYWADIIYDKSQDPDEKDTESPWFMDEKYTKAPENFPVEDYSTRKKVIDFLGRQMNRIFLNDDLTLNYSFISDTIINRYFKDLEVYYSGNVSMKNNESYKAGDLIKERLYYLLKKHKNDEIMLIGHSMGSIIAFDVLTFMASDIRINTLITMGSPLGLPAVISKIAGERKLRGISSNHVTTPPDVTRNWYNFSDILDKVAFNYKLSDYYSENGHGVKPVDLLVVNNYVIDGVRNPHKSFGYLRTPEFTEILNEFIMSEKLTIIRKVTRRLNKITDNLKSIITPSKTKE